jgi:hypothetical protein
MKNTEQQFCVLCKPNYTCEIWGVILREEHKFGVLYVRNIGPEAEDLASDGVITYYRL